MFAASFHYQRQALTPSFHTSSGSGFRCCKAGWGSCAAPGATGTSLPAAVSVSPAGVAGGITGGPCDGADIRRGDAGGRGWARQPVVLQKKYQIANVLPTCLAAQGIEWRAVAIEWCKCAFDLKLYEMSTQKKRLRQIHRFNLTKKKRGGTSLCPK